MHSVSTLIMTALVAAGLSTAAGAGPAPSPSMQIETLGGIINVDADDTLAFTPDGNTVFFDRSEGPHKTIMVSHRVAGRWSPPQTARFSGRWFDQDPVVAPDGSYMLFNSDRPVTPGGPALTQTYFTTTPRPGANIWRVDRKGSGWGEPRWIGPVINSTPFIDFASIAGDDTLYFMRFDQANKVMQLWRSRYRRGRYETAARVVLGSPMVAIHDPAVAKDQSFIVFDYGKVTGGLGRLSIAFRKGEGWTDPIDLGDAANADIPWGAHLAPDNRTAYVTGKSGIWRFDLTPWLSKRPRS